MPNFQNNKPFMTSNTDGEDRLGHIRPEAIANALLREAVTNARNQGNDIRTALIDKVGLPLWMVQITELMDHSNLEAWHRALKQGYLRRGVTLQQVEVMIKIKQFISEELMTMPQEDETKNLQFKSTIETAVVRKAERPQKSNNTNFTPEKGSYDAPEYDGKDHQYDKQGNLWVFPTKIVQWKMERNEETGKLEGVPGNDVVKIEDLRKLYREKMERGDASGIPIQHLKYEVKDWIREWKPTVQETHERPDADRRNDIEYWKRQELRKLRNAVAQAQAGRASAFWKLAFKYCGNSARVTIEDLSLEKRVENQIRRKYNNKKTRVEGKAYLPPLAAGDMLLPLIDEKVRALVAHNPDLDDRLPWVILTYFDAEAREYSDGDSVVTPGVGILMNKHRDAENDN